MYPAADRMMVNAMKNGAMIMQLSVVVVS